jgi:hypothetical protein
MDFEPKLMLETVSPDGRPEAVVPVQPADVQRLTVSLERARKKAALYESLYKKGIVAKVEAEACELSIVRITKELDDARLVAAQSDADAMQKRLANHEIQKEEVDKAVAEVTADTTVAKEASAAWDRAQMDAALLNLKRQRQLQKAGVVSKSAVKRAEEKVLALGGDPDGQPAPKQ